MFYIHACFDPFMSNSKYYTLIESAKNKPILVVNKIVSFLKLDKRL